MKMEMQERVVRLADKMGSLSNLVAAVGVTYTTGHNWKTGRNEPRGTTLKNFEELEKKYLNIQEMFWREMPAKPEQPGHYNVWMERDGGFFDRDEFDGNQFAAYGDWVTFWMPITNPRTGGIAL